MRTPKRRCAVGAPPNPAMQYVLFKRFVKIRRFGIYNHTIKHNLEIQFIPEEKPSIDAVIKQQKPLETNVEWFERLTGVYPCICPARKTGRLIAVWELSHIRSLPCMEPSEKDINSIITNIQIVPKQYWERYACKPAIQAKKAVCKHQSAGANDVKKQRNLQ